MKLDEKGLTRSISDLLRLAGVIVFGAWNEKYKQPKFIENAAQEDLYQKFLRMVDHGKINEAENELIDYIEQNVLSGEEQQEGRGGRDLSVLEMALCVYGYMNDKEDVFLSENDFSREEIQDGIEGVLSMYGIAIPGINYFP